MQQPLIIALSRTGFSIAEKLSQLLDGEIMMPSRRADGHSENTIRSEQISRDIRNAFEAGRPVIGVMAAGSLIRILAASVTNKMEEPPVIAVAEDGSSVVPLLGGHHGANDLARKIAAHIRGHPAITTAGDLRFGIALDMPPDGWALANPDQAKKVMADLLAGETVQLEGESLALAKWLIESKMTFAKDAKITFQASTFNGVPDTQDTLQYVPKLHVLGMGCERGASAEEAIALAQSVLKDAAIHPASLAAIASIDLKADEPALRAVAQHFDVPIRFFAAERLAEETPRLANPSDVVFAEVGCHGVAEGAALALVGENGVLSVEKRKSKRVTAAVAKSQQVLTKENIMAQGCERGRLFVVGIGPGHEAWRSPEVTRMIGEATDLVGYSLYLDLISDISGGKARHDFDLGKEEDRVRRAMELAGEGKDVALVCSGDAGIYAMATLVFELLNDGGLSAAAKRIAIAVSPGISALQAAAARAGAPLGHDFCTISLSDLLTPWEAIKMRVKAAAEGDFVIAFYNPVSRRRRTQLAHAKEILLQHRPEDTPVILATNLGRQEEHVRVVSLRDLSVDDVDMLTVVIVGSSETKTVSTGEGKTWVYTPRGYSAKAGSGIKPAQSNGGEAA